MTSQIIRYTLMDSPLGDLLVARTGRGLWAITWAEQPHETLAEWEGRHPECDFVRDDGALEAEVAQLRAYFDGELTRFELAIDLAVTDFQAQVLQALEDIPYGETRTYAQIAESIGKPNASRAVGNACAQNPLPVVIPCHRVLHTSGQKMGYSGGIDRKRTLLSLEQASVAQADGVLIK